ncbi:hypothetical protein JB92DRAFT_3095200 [Gautieria morchelliformis]|nr:hypothetical protein JB92DRAFT_3095200 [Gautieria morchelliformis]
MSEARKRQQPYDAGERDSRSRTGSPPRKIQRLETAPYPATPEEHAQMDVAVLEEGVLQAFLGQESLSTPTDIAPFLMTRIVETAERLHPTYLQRPEAKALLTTEDGLLNELQEAWNKKSFAHIRDLAILQQVKTVFPSKEDLERERHHGDYAAWTTPYKGDEHMAFIKKINLLYNRRGRELHSHHVVLTQSSGTGKSRMLHEVSRHTFTVIFNIGNWVTGWPDVEISSYLACSYVEGRYANRPACFLTALFIKLSAMDFNSPSELTEFLGYGDPGKRSQREAFFDSVLRAAKESQQQFAGREEEKLNKAASGLISKLSKLTPDRKAVELLLAFDDATDLALRDMWNSWNTFQMFRKVFYYLHDQPIFHVFVTATGFKSVTKVRPFEPKSSSSVYQDITHYDHAPITFGGYDQFAMSLTEGQSLDDATTMDYMLSLGRPLFKLRYDNGTRAAKRDIVQFAEYKLLNGQKATEDAYANMAPLATRLPLEFNALNDIGRYAEKQLVESHMRLCFTTVPETNKMYTVAPSEPILVEAATCIMVDKEGLKDYTAVDVLNILLVDGYISGDRGVLVCMLLMLLARDQACHVPRIPSKGLYFHTLVPVTKFLASLFVDGHKATVLGAQAYEGGPSLEEAFKDSWTYCTHFVKVEDHTVVNRKFLMRLMARGAGILCADGQLGIDVIIPVCYKGKTLATENITVIAVLSKNVAHLRKPRNALFANMDPYYAGIFSADHPGDIPIIKLVLNVGAKSAVFACPSPWKRPAEPESGCTSKGVPLSQQHFRLFAAGLSHEVFRPVQDIDEGTWSEVVSPDPLWDTYGLAYCDEHTVHMGRRLTPCARSDPGHWATFFPLDSTVNDIAVDVASTIDDETEDGDA